MRVYSPGKINQTTTDDNLSSTATRIALLMLANGVVSLKFEKYDFLLQQLNISQTNIDTLVNRGVLKKNKHEKKIEFFHQTFFEHSAARALLEKYSAAVFRLLEEKTFPENLEMNFFFYPIYEQILVLSENSLERNKSLEIVEQLLESKNIDKIRAAIYAYCFFNQEYDKIYESFSNLVYSFPKGDSAIIKRYLFNAANLPLRRLLNSFKLLQQIWNRGVWNEQYHIIDLLEYYSTKSSHNTLSFLEKNGVVEAVLAVQTQYEKKESNPAMPMLIKSIINLYSFNEEFVVNFCNKLINYEDKKIHFLLFRTLLNNELLKRNQIVESLFERCYLLHENVLSQDHDYVETMPDIIHEMYYNKWISLNVPIEQLLHDISNEQRIFVKIAKIQALGRYSSYTPKDQQHFIFDYFQNSIERKDLFRVGTPLLTAILNTDRGYLVQTFLKHFKVVLKKIKQIDDATIKDSKEYIFTSCYIEAIKNIKPKNDYIIDKSLKYILQPNLLSGLHPKAPGLVLSLFLIKCNSAVSIINGTEIHFVENRSLAIGISTGIVENEKDLHELYEFALQICIQYKLLSVLCTLLKRIANGIGLFLDKNKIPDYVIKYQQELLSIVYEFASQDKESQKESAHLLYSLFRLDIAESINLETLSSLYSIQSEDILSWIVELYPYCHYNDAIEFEALLECCRANLNNKSMKIRSKSEKSFLLLIYNSNFNCSRYLEEILGIYTKGAVDASDVKTKIINRIISRHVDFNREFAFQLFYRLMTSDFLNVIRKRNENEIMHQLRSGCISLCQKLEYSESVKLVNILATTGCEYGKMIIAGLAFDKSKLKTYRDKMYEIKNVEDTKPCIKIELTNVLQFKSEAVGNLWPELLG